METTKLTLYLIDFGDVYNEHDEYINYLQTRFYSAEDARDELVTWLAANLDKIDFLYGNNCLNQEERKITNRKIVSVDTDGAIVSADIMSLQLSVIPSTVVVDGKEYSRNDVVPVGDWTHHYTETIKIPIIHDVLTIKHK